MTSHKSRRLHIGFKLHEAVAVLSIFSLVVSRLEWYSNEVCHGLHWRGGIWFAIYPVEERIEIQDANRLPLILHDRCCRYLEA